MIDPINKVLKAIDICNDNIVKASKIIEQILSEPLSDSDKERYQSLQKLIDILEYINIIREEF
jgi:hypothetical protein